MIRESFIAKNHNKVIRKHSRSGGVFPALCEVILSQNGVVYGCVTNEKHHAEHKKATSREECKRFSGSKYVQSDMKNCFREVKEDLLAGKKVLFSGTGCQVAALKRYLTNVDTDSLITADIVCHGVPSPAIWQAFLDWAEEKYHGKVEAVDFRDKKYGWMVHVGTVTIDGKKRTPDSYRALFRKNYILRPSCYVCPYASFERQGDITLADAWGVDVHHTDFNDDKGCSLVLVNTPAGKECLDAAMGDLTVRNVDMADFMQPNLRAPSQMPKDRDEFWKDFHTDGFQYISQKYGNNSPKGNLVAFLKRVFGILGMTKKVKRVFKM